MRNYITEVEDALSIHPRRTSLHHPESYIGGGQSKLRYIGLKAAHLEQTLRKGFSFSDLSMKEAAKAWDQVWRESDCYEVMALALAWYGDRKRVEMLVDHWPRLKKWSARVDNWAHADTLCGMYAHILEQKQSLVYPVLRRWSLSRSPWLRRISIVSLLYYSSQRKKVPPLSKILALVEPQIEYDHYYVQKGVGWVLREAGNVYPKETFRFLEKNIKRLSPPAFSAATEKLSKQQKQRLKGLRGKRSKVRA